MPKPRLIAFYLPQFYPTPENDEWWGKGFTEWTNVGRAKPLFRGHLQPRVPADLGYYDLRVPEVRIQQAELAKYAGIEGFCYWHYWFGNGKRLLDRVFSEVVESGSPDYPFCLCWANHSWYQKTWDPTKPNKLLIEQTYPGEKDYENHFYAMLNAFKDKRYLKVDGKLVFGIYDPIGFADFPLFKKTWDKLAKENGIASFYFVGFTFKPEKIEYILGNGFDAVTVDYILNFKDNKLSFWDRVKRKFFKIPQILHYDDYAKWIKMNYKEQKNVHPCICPNFDHSPRSQERGTVISDHSPQKWEKMCRDMFNQCSTRDEKSNLIFVKAWNEWGEGNYLEPDLTYGREFIEATRRAVNSNEKK